MSFLKPLNADEFGTLLTLGAGALGSILIIIVNCIHGSKCKHIKCCGLECDRQVNNEDEAPVETPEETPANTPRLLPDNNP
tara:strand:+ start:946 stop:1188 length:243 start_codon:yes stop_codon:yes gene_type:complete